MLKKTILALTALMPVAVSAHLRRCCGSLREDRGGEQDGAREEDDGVKFRHGEIS